MSVSSADLGSALVGLAGVAVGSLVAVVQQRLAVADARRHERVVRWDVDRRAAYVRIVDFADQLYRALDDLDGSGLQISITDDKDRAALAASDGVYRSRNEVSLLTSSPAVADAAQVLLRTCSELFVFAKTVPPSDQDDQLRQAATAQFFELEDARKRAVETLIDAAAEELGTKLTGRA